MEASANRTAWIALLALTKKQKPPNPFGSPAPKPTPAGGGHPRPSNPSDGRGSPDQVDFKKSLSCGGVLLRLTSVCLYVVLSSFFTR